MAYTALSPLAFIPLRLTLSGGIVFSPRSLWELLTLPSTKLLHLAAFLPGSLKKNHRK